MVEDVVWILVLISIVVIAMLTGIGENFERQIGEKL